MLKALHVRNYALIRHLEIEFRPGFTIITGETGAGKSILLGALSLLLGNRADTSVLKDKEKKCIVEGSFDISSYGYHSFFTLNDMDYDDLLIIRREISPGGKSRAFINDTPVNLHLLKELGSRLVDIHSQHENLNLGEHEFQLMVLDTVARNRPLLSAYQDQFHRFTDLVSGLSGLKEKAGKSRADLDYYTFQYQQLAEAGLSSGEQEGLELELQTLDHAEDIKLNLQLVFSLLSDQEDAVISKLGEAIRALEGISSFLPAATEFAERIRSTMIELKDIAEEAETGGADIEIDPGRQQIVRERLDMIFNLMKKHGVNDVDGLISLQAELDARIKDIASYDEQIEKFERELTEKREQLKKQGAELTTRRKKILPEIEREVNGMLNVLGIPNAVFKVQHGELKDFTESGKDEVEFLFSANKQVAPHELSRVASGGELSRLMLSIKSLLSDSLELPTIIFDEVDSGVSGEIAEKVGAIMKKMSHGIQVINITHLPQVAGKGDFHYLVHKYDDEAGATITDIRLLADEDRVLEIARMLSGEELTEAAISNARELLN
jgi:DNA repair protein RecN (Recombination protein N)